MIILSIFLCDVQSIGQSEVHLSTHILSVAKLVLFRNISEVLFISIA